MWLLGFLPLVLDYATTYVPRDALPQPISRLIQAGSTWTLSLVLLAIGLLASAYLVHREDLQNSTVLANELQALKHQEPALVVGLASQGGPPAPVIIIHLPPVSTPPDFDAQVEHRRQQLLALRPPPKDTSLPEYLGTLASFTLANALSDPNPRFEEEIREYLPLYRKFLIEKYEVRIPRAFEIHPIITNIGTTTATSVILEIQLPQAFEPPRPHQLAQLQYFDERLLDAFPHKPPEPKPSIERFGQDFLHYGLGLLDEPTPGPSDPNDPEIHQREGRLYVTYHIPLIVPKRSFSDLNPFPIWAGSVVPPTTWHLTTALYCRELSSPLQSTLQIRFS